MSRFGKNFPLMKDHDILTVLQLILATVISTVNMHPENSSGRYITTLEKYGVISIMKNSAGWRESRSARNCNNRCDKEKRNRRSFTTMYVVFSSIVPRSQFILLVASTRQRSLSLRILHTWLSQMSTGRWNRQEAPFRPLSAALAS